MYPTQYSDTLLIALAKARCPEFRDQVQVDHKNATVGPTTLRGRIREGPRYAGPKERELMLTCVEVCRSDDDR